ncbi:MAG: DUF1456 family protein [Bacteroidales bacterium]|nr:DUF1456 family protein [Bacteroidales bacterium]
MDNNDVIRKIRYIFDYNDSKMIEIFELASLKVNRSDISNWLKKDSDPAFVELSDNKLAIFLNGIIIEKRGKREGPQPIPEKRLNNNIIFRKVKIAMDLKSDDILEMFKSINKSISEHELSAFLRNPNHRKYRECNDQYLRNFLSGIQFIHLG